MELVNNKAHLTLEGLEKIVNIKASMDLGLSDMLISEFPGYVPVERPVINNDNVILNPYLISGLLALREILMFVYHPPIVNWVIEYN